jgi:DNA-binding NarL/FixJ family response regulator
LLEENGLTVGAQASGRDEALGLAFAEPPDLALVDLSVDDDTGLTLVAELHRLGIPVVVCSSHEEPAYVRRALDSGARAYVAKRDLGRALVRTLRDVLNGWVLISPRAADDLPDGT